MPSPRVLSKFLSGSLTGYLDTSNIANISVQLKFASLGQTWINLLAFVVEHGAPMGDEGRECLGIDVAFCADGQRDVILERFGNREIISEMEKVFFTKNSNSLGHSYAGLARGPGGRSDLQDVIALLRSEPWSKRAVLTLCASGTGEVPCVNVIQFLIRGGAVEIMYFARGQDVFRKFYADGLCIASMARTVAGALGIKAGSVTGFIGSGHFYREDMDAIRQVLSLGSEYLTASPRVAAGRASRHGFGNAAALTNGLVKNNTEARSLNADPLAAGGSR